jgi:hypothetical protein
MKSYRREKSNAVAITSPKGPKGFNKDKAYEITCTRSGQNRYRLFVEIEI